MFDAFKDISSWYISNLFDIVLRGVTHLKDGKQTSLDRIEPWTEQ